MVAAAAVAGIIMYNPFLLYFQNDDFIHIPLSAQGQLFQHNSFRPVCDLSVMIDYNIWGKNAYGYHITNIILHAANSLLVYALAKKISYCFSIFNENKFAPAAAAILFFIYAAHSEAVFWILGRSAMLGFFFFALSCIFYFERKKTLYLIASMLCMLLAWLSYESTWILPVVFAVMELGESSKLKAESSKLRIFIALTLFAAYLTVRYFTIHEVIGNYEAGQFLRLNIPVLFMNFIKMFCRAWLPFLSGSLFAALSVVIIILFTALCFLIKQGRYIYFVLFFLFKISLLPAASIGVSTQGMEGERFLYLPSLFCCIIFVYLFCVFAKNSKQFIASFSILIIFQLYFLRTNAVNYQTAGNITKAFTTAIAGLPEQSRVTIENLPQETCGALILRTGVNEAAQWMRDSVPAEIHICSREKIPHEKYYFDYRIKYADKNSALSPACTETGEKYDVYVKFTDSALVVYQ